MINALVLHSSPTGIRSSSREVAASLIQNCERHIPGVRFRARNLDAELPPHWTQNHIAAAYAPADERTADQKRILELSDEYCRELLSARHLIITAPMWNFGVPSSLKAWVDHVVRIGVTFMYDAESRPIGLVTQIESAWVVVASGGVYTEGPISKMDHAGPHIVDVLKFIGVRQVKLIRVEGTAVDRALAIQSARTNEL